MATNAFQSFSPDWWSQVLEQSEPLQYYSSPAGTQFASRSPRRRRYFEDSYQNILSDYYGQAGASMRQGQAPTSFMDFLETNPWTARYTSLPQSNRNVTGMGSNPRTRFLFNY